jgi:argininosuccinate lyase
MTKRLWDKGQQLDQQIHAFTVGDDPTIDLNLVHWDCLASAAHARMLNKINILNNEETNALIKGLNQIDKLHADGKFEIQPEQEDVHTAIENWLTENVGEPGQKIHTGRSRNDQVATAMRLWLKNATFNAADRIITFIESALTRADDFSHIPMPGYTHLQRAMPSSIAMWLHAFIEAALDQLRASHALLDRLDSCPLGSGAGFGLPLPLDREYTAKLLGFSRVQRSVIDVQNSRGRYELTFLRLASDIGSIIEKLACDISLYTSQEFSFLTLPDALTTGSSIMPQKRNPDVVELLRARSGQLRGYETLLTGVIAKLPSNYHRDLQLTKRPVFQAETDLTQITSIATRVIESLTPNEQRLTAAMTPELYATAAAYDLVKQGTPFRTAYRQIADQVTKGTFHPTPEQQNRALSDQNIPQQLQAAKTETKKSRDSFQSQRDSFNEVQTNCLTT